MEPLSALSVAAAIAQFVDYSIKLVVSARDIHRSTGGILSEYADLDTTTTSLLKLCKNLDESLMQGGADGCLTSNDFEVHKIANGYLGSGTVFGWQELVPLLLGSLREQVEASARSQLAAHEYGKAIGETFLSYVEEERQWRDDLMLAIHASHKADANHAASSIGYSDSEISRRFGKLVTNRLRFSDMKDREDNIADAHRKTFEWIFHGPRVGQNPWSSFIHWLQIVSLFPEEWEIYAILGVEPRNFTFSDLRRAFRALKNACTDDTKLCLFVDGLDEFDGRPMDLIDLLKDIVASPQIKICMASRPWVVFDEEFRTVPSLRLQDLTEPDIKLYVSEKFQAHSMFSDIQKHEKKLANDLINNVTDRASGVFLWVRLVVQSLLEGLSSGDRISDLRVRLDTIPGDLEGLFQKILDSIEPSHFGDASQLFQINRAALEPLSLLGFYFADYDIAAAKTQNIMPMTEDEALYKAKIMARRLNSRCKGLLEIGNANSITDSDDGLKKLMVKISSKSYMDDSVSRRSVVHYLHRSVRDWLERPIIWEKLLLATPTPFNAKLSLSKSFLLQLKTSQPSISAEEFWHLIYSSIFFAWTAADIAQAKPIMDELHHTFCQLSDCDAKTRRNRQVGPYPAAEIFLNLAVYCSFDFSVEAQLRSPHLRPSLRASADRVSPLRRAVEDDIATFSSHALGNLFEQKLVEIEKLFQESKTTAPSVRCITLLLEHGANPNEVVRPRQPTRKPAKATFESTAWTSLVYYCVPELLSLAHGPLTREGENICRTWLLILTAFLSHGAAWTREMNDFIETKIMADRNLQAKFGDELEKLRLAQKGSREASKRLSFKKLFSRLKQRSAPAR
ncbi:hypothetical protein DL770_004948 [Monosporascus sp. CRB-9-2]|nr:hypothetical protein DL770_004948 [Monosporascus sp. CRB-9-2]